MERLLGNTLRRAAKRATHYASTVDYVTLQYYGYCNISYLHYITYTLVVHIHYASTVDNITLHYNITVTSYYII